MAALQLRVLVCDDEPSIRKTLKEILEDESYLVDCADSAENMLSLLRKPDARYDAILLDVWLTGMDGVAAFAKMRELGHQVPVIFISGHATLDVAVKAAKMGAFDFLEKPLNLDKVLLTLQNAVKQSRLEKKQARLTAQLLPKVEIIGASPAIVRLKDEIAQAAPTTGRVLILGESGSGKELAARLIHQLSDRAHEPFIEMNCAAIPEELIESELLGHVKGSFTGASDNKQGKFEQADGGTLFLDEIADMSLQTQAKVLRVLQEQRFQQVGGSKLIQVDVRVIAATNKDLEKEIAEGRFREDLFFRLSVIPLQLAPLRERLEDIPLLCEHFIQQFARSLGRKPKSFTPHAMAVMSGYPWPGNIRELRNVIERLMIMSRKELLEPEDLPRQIQGRVQDAAWFGQFDSLKDARDDFERRYIEWTLKKVAGNMTKAAEHLKLERSHLYKKLKQFGIETTSHE